VSLRRDSSNMETVENLKVTPSHIRKWNPHRKIFLIIHSGVLTVWGWFSQVRGLACICCLSVPLRKWPDVPGVVRWAGSVSLESDKHPLLVCWGLNQVKLGAIEKPAFQGLCPSKLALIYSRMWLNCYLATGVQCSVGSSLRKVPSHLMSPYLSNFLRQWIPKGFTGFWLLPFFFNMSTSRLSYTNMCCPTP
jgi:hypothetical protein